MSIAARDEYVGARLTFCGLRRKMLRGFKKICCPELKRLKRQRKIKRNFNVRSISFTSYLSSTLASVFLSNFAILIILKIYQNRRQYEFNRFANLLLSACFSCSFQPLRPTVKLPSGVEKLHRSKASPNTAWQTVCASVFPTRPNKR